MEVRLRLLDQRSRPALAGPAARLVRCFGRGEPALLGVPADGACEGFDILAVLDAANGLYPSGHGGTDYERSFLDFYASDRTIEGFDILCCLDAANGIPESYWHP